MSKHTKEQFRKINLNKQKIESAITKIKNREENFTSENDLTIENLESGIIIDADFSNNNFGKIVYVKFYQDSKQVKQFIKYIPVQELKTNGIARWGNDRVETFFPEEQEFKAIMGESVMAELDSSVALNFSSAGERCENLCELLKNVKDEEILEQIIRNSKTLFIGYLMLGYSKLKLDEDENEYIFDKIKIIQESFEPLVIAENFNKTKFFIQNRIKKQVKGKKTYELRPKSAKNSGYQKRGTRVYSVSKNFRAKDKRIR